MASGFGYTGGRSRCFPFWQDFQQCYAKADTPEECTLQKEDYLECLHHTKEVSRALRIKSEYLSKTAGDLETKRQQAEQDADSGILGLGLLRQEQEKREENVHVVVVVKEETAKQGADKAEEVREEKARLV